MKPVVRLVTILALCFSVGLLRTKQPVIPNHNILFVLAHPDDESMFMVITVLFYH